MSLINQSVLRALRVGPVGGLCSRSHALAEEPDEAHFRRLPAAGGRPWAGIRTVIATEDSPRGPGPGAASAVTSLSI